MKRTKIQIVDGGLAAKAAAPVAQSAVRRKRSDVAGLELSNPDLSPNVRSAVMQLMDEIDRMADELAEAQARAEALESLADEDPLVPVLNRRGFVRELERALAYATRYGTTGALVFCDLDGFKAINDRHGHAAGDAALRHVGEILSGQVRRSDIVGRLGGDEFAIVLHQASRANAEAKAKELATVIAATPVSFEGDDIPLVMTPGVAEFASGETADDLIARADKAMYAAKLARRGGADDQAVRR